MNIIIGALVTIGIFMVGQLVAAVWWASAISTKMDFVITTTNVTSRGLQEHTASDLATFSTKTEVAQALVNQEKELATALGFANKELSAMWKQIDKLTGVKP